MSPQTPTTPTPTQPPVEPAVPPVAAAPAAEVPPVPETWPGAFGVYKHSRAAVMKNVGILVAVWIIAAVLNIVLGKLFGDAQLGQIILDLIMVYLALITYHVYLAGCDGQKLDFGQAFAKAANPAMYGKLLIISLLMWLAIGIGFILLIVPGVIILSRLVLAPYYLVDRNLGIGESLSTAWNESKGHVGKVWGIVGVYILMALLMITIIGIPFSIYLLFMYSASLAVLYRFIGKNHPVAAATTTASPTATPPTVTAAPTAPATPEAPATKTPPADTSNITTDNGASDDNTGATTPPAAA